MAVGRVPCVLAAGAALALAGLGQSSALWLPLDTLAHFTPQLLISAALMTAAAALPRARVLLALLSVPFAIVLVGLWPSIAGSRDEPPPAGERSVRVMTYNVWARNASPDDAAAPSSRLMPISWCWWSCCRAIVACWTGSPAAIHIAHCVPGRAAGSPWPRGTPSRWRATRV